MRGQGGIARIDQEAVELPFGEAASRGVVADPRHVVAGRETETLWLATFSCMWQGGAPTRLKWGPAGVGLSEALAWARDQADRVLVQLADAAYSAGRLKVRDAGVRDWPPEDLERLPGLGDPGVYLGEVRTWHSRFELELSAPAFREASASFRTALEADPTVELVGAGADSDARTLRAEFFLDAPLLWVANHLAICAGRRAATAGSALEDTGVIRLNVVPRSAKGGPQ